MTRPVPIPPGLVLAALPVGGFAHTGTQTAPPATSESSPVPASPAPAPVAPTGSAERGKQLTFTCQGCHGVVGYKNAYPNYHVPLIGGQSAPYLVTALNEYQKGTRKHPTMQAPAMSFSEQDIADMEARPDNLRVGKECERNCRTRVVPYN